MACYWPRRLYKLKFGGTTNNLNKDADPFLTACGRCIGCNIDKAKDWALRCHHEYTLHTATTFATPTYSDEHLPPTLSKKHLSAYLKRLRARIDDGPTPTKIRFFASGEYGETTHRAHYHVLLFGADASHYQAIQEAWPHGEVRDIKPAVAESIAYVAGYCAKKYGEEISTQRERVDRRTGEVYNYQPPFILMSRGGRNNKGIGGHHRDQFTNSWEKTATLNGYTQRVPRYYKQKWNETASRKKLSKNEIETHEIMKTINITEQQRKAAELIARDKQKIKAQRRTAM